jgi:hypothetical protein
VAWLLHFHGILALAALYFGYRLRRSLLERPVETHRPMERVWATALLASVAGAFGTGVALYAAYRAPGGVREWLLAHAPSWHHTWFEWKEHLGFFALACAAGLWLVAGRQAGPARTAAAFPLLVTLLAALLVTTVVGGSLSFCVRSVG